jgi:hypothetical protein
MYVKIFSATSGYHLIPSVNASIFADLFIAMLRVQLYISVAAGTASAFVVFGLFLLMYIIASTCYLSFFRKKVDVRISTGSNSVGYVFSAATTHIKLILGSSKALCFFFCQLSHTSILAIAVMDGLTLIYARAAPQL